MFEVDYAPTERTTPTRYRERARYDAETIHSILDEALVAHVGFVIDGTPRVLPMLHVRIGQMLYLHGSTGATLTSMSTVDVCATVTLVDGLIFTRSGNGHSMRYRSVVAHGSARRVTDATERARVFDALLDHVAAGRSADVGPIPAKELAKAAVLALPLSAVSAKVNTKTPVVEPDEVDLPYWAGVLPLRIVAGAPETAPTSAGIPTPPYLAAYRRPSTVDIDPWRTAETLTGEHIRLEPLGPQHIDGLLAAGEDEEVWRWSTAHQPRSRREMIQHVSDILHAVSTGERVAWAQIDQRTGEVAGTTSYYEIVPGSKAVAIGHTWLGRRWWRGPYNTESKLLLLGRAFDDLGAIRVTWHVDIRNERSQAAVTRIGGVREGVLRRHRIRPDGSLRDTVIFSMTDAEWPAARDRLTQRLRSRG